MLFNSLTFAVFFAVVYGLYLAFGRRGQNRLLLAASYLFYGAWDWRFLSLILLSTTVDYHVAAAIGRSRNARRRRALLGVSLAVNLGVLGLFKYAGFFLDSLHTLLGALGLRTPVPGLAIVLPVGISFYTFQTLSYTIDVYRGRLAPARRVADLALFVAFFPQLVAGPIERAAHLLPQIRHRRVVTFARLSEGAALFLYGCFQKVVVADNLAQYVDRVFADPHRSGGLPLLLAVYAFAFQIFCDFAGYSNMARGLAAALGFRLSVNFHSPYLAASPSEFWSRWHISLSTWLRDYLYIPLGGSRAGARRTLRNLVLTMFLGGLWHGASWTFVAWGLFHGALLAVYRGLELLPCRPAAGGHPRGAARAWLAGLAARLVWFHLVCAGWVIFRADSLADAGHILLSLARLPLNLHGPPILPLLARYAPWVAIVLFVQYVQYRRRRDDLAIRTLPLPMRAALYYALFYAIVIFGVNHGQSFIYFQF